MSEVTAALFGGQILNIYLCLGIPWLLDNIFNGSMGVDSKFILPAVCVTFVMIVFCLVIMYFNDRKLSDKVGYALVGVYLVYIPFILFGTYDY